MRALEQPFCAVCNQRWSLETFGHPRVAPTAPAAGQVPASPTAAWTGVPADFEVLTRLSVGPNIVNRFTWSLVPPGAVFPVLVGSGSPALILSFSEPGTYELTAQVVADINFVKPERWDANVDLVHWTVEVEELTAPGEVSAPGAIDPLRFVTPQSLQWEDASAAGVFTYNLYRGAIQVLGTSYGDCYQTGLEQNSAVVAEQPPPGSGWSFLVTGVNPLGEGPLGEDSAGQPRPNDSPCP
jgi:hypothetical protein